MNHLYNPVALNRREFVGSLTIGALLLPNIIARLHETLDRPSPNAPHLGLVDSHGYLFPWPFRKLPEDEAALLAARLQKYGVKSAWVGSLEAVLHKDLASVNARLVECCERFGRDLFLPCGTVNPVLATWEACLEECAKQYRMRVIRLFPAYHGYALNDPRVGELFRQAAQLGLRIQIVVEMEDVRTRNPVLSLQPVDIRPLKHWLTESPALRVMLLNPHRSIPRAQIIELAAAGQVYLDLGMLEGMAALEQLLAALPHNCICFGSFAPMFYFESALLKMVESQLSEKNLRAIASENAREFLG